MPPLATTPRPKRYLGIDPGASGGFALLLGDGSATTWPADKIVTDRDLWEWFKDLNSVPVDIFATIEKVGGFIKGNPAPGSTMFNFGAGYGKLLMALTAAGIPHEEVHPNKWQRALGIPTRKKKETKTQFKNRLKQTAQRLFPSLTITLATCDALLLALYGKRKAEGNL